MRADLLISGAVHDFDATVWKERAADWLRREERETAAPVVVDRIIIDRRVIVAAEADIFGVVKQIERLRRDESIV